MTASARAPASSLGTNPSMRLSALPGPRTGPGDSFDTSRFPEAQPASASPAMPPSRRSTDPVDGNVRAALGPAPGLAARALPRVVGPGLGAVLARERQACERPGPGVPGHAGGVRREGGQPACGLVAGGAHERGVGLPEDGGHDGAGAALGLPAVDLGEHVAPGADDAALPRRLGVDLPDRPGEPVMGT